MTDETTTAIRTPLMTAALDGELIYTDEGEGAVKLREGSIVELEYETTYRLTLRGVGGG